MQTYSTIVGGTPEIGVCKQGPRPIIRFPFVASSDLLSTKLKAACFQNGKQGEALRKAKPAVGIPIAFLEQREAPLRIRMQRVINQIGNVWYLTVRIIKTESLVPVVKFVLPRSPIIRISLSRAFSNPVFFFCPRNPFDCTRTNEIVELRNLLLL